MATINAAWHAAHVLGRGATLAQRVAWHRAHQEHCACRPVPASLTEHLATPNEPRRAAPKSARPPAAKKRASARAGAGRR